MININRSQFSFQNRASQYQNLYSLGSMIYLMEISLYTILAWKGIS